MRKNLLCTFALLSSIFFSGTSRAQSAPTISYTTPVNGPVGTSIKIVGNNFGSTQSSSTIAFNGTTATPTSWSNTQIVAPVPTGATTGPILVTVGGVASNHVNFTVGTPPTISYTNPVNGPVGTSVTIVGTYFGSTQGSSTLTFNGTSATPTSWSSTQIVTPVPSGATTGPVVATVGGVVSNHVNFTVGTPPTVSYTNPIDGPVGTTVTIAGNYFGSTQGSSTITFNGTPATPTSWSNTQILAAVPSGSATGPVVVTVGSLASNHVNFIVGTPPTISYTNPIDGPTGTSITIFGNYFGSTVGNITFNGTAATPTSWTNTQIVVPVPTGASTGPLVVTAGGMPSNSVNFIVGTPPTISYTNPVRAAVGSSIAIVGNYFGSTQGTSTITFNGTAATPSSWANTQITVPIPAGSSTGPLLIAVGGMNSNSVNFTVVPNIISLSPSRGPSGTTVTIAGTTFGLAQGSSTVTFNGTLASPTSWSDSQITVPVPSSASTGPVVVTAAGNATNNLNFTFLPTPSITRLSPNAGSAGASVTITGANFGPSQGSSTVTFNGTAATTTSWSPTSIIVPVPNGASTGNVVVTESGVASNGASFTVATGTPPTITAAASPAPNASGWNNSNVTVTFTCTAGSAAVATCPSPQAVSTEGTNQVISGTATDTNGLTATATVNLNIDKTIPVLAVTTPADGTAFTTSGVTVSGTVSDALSGVSTLTCNGSATAVSSGGFSCNISLNIGVNLVVVRATDLAGNVAASISHLSLAGTLPAPQSLQVTPANVNMLINETQQFTAVDEQGRPRSDATWTVSDTTLASIDTSNSPTLTAVALGQVTLTATVLGASAQAQINILNGTSLTPGTVLWTAPLPNGFGCTKTVQAVPTPNATPDLYCFGVTGSPGFFIQALTADGQQMWLKTWSGYGVDLKPDAIGGIIVQFTDPSSNQVVLADIDGLTGAEAWRQNVYTDFNIIPSSEIFQNYAIRGDGTIFDSFNDTTAPYSVVMRDGNTGQARLNLPIQQSTFNDVGCGTVLENGPISQPFVDTDGATNFLYTVYQATRPVCGVNQNTTITSTLWLMKIGPDNSITSQPITSSASFIDPGQAIPDGQRGLLAVWALTSFVYSGVNQGLYVVHVSSNGAVISTLRLDQAVPGFSGVYQMVLGENGTAFATDGNSLVSFDIGSGGVNWTVQPASGVSAMNAIAGGGVTITDNSANLIAIDAQGNIGTGIPSVTSVSPWSLGSTTWFGLANAIASLFAGPSSELASSPWPASGAEPQHQNAANPTAKITVNFAGPLSPGDNLTFSGAGTCGNTLGLRYCAKQSWFWYVEGVATVSDDASKWTVHQHAVELRSGFRTNSQGTLNSFQSFFNSSTIPGDDDPCTPNDSLPGCQGTVSVQQQPGQTKIFWIDDPGSLYLYDMGGHWIDSLHMNGQFTSKVCNRFLICANVPWFIGIVVDPGSNLNFSLSAAGLAP